MRCPGCNKFPAFEIGDPEVDLSIEGAAVNGSVRLVLTTECCGEEAKEANFDIDLDLSEEFSTALVAAGIAQPDKGFDFSDMEFALDSEDCTGDDRYENKDRHGKPIKSSRYMRHFYCIQLNITASCTYKQGDSETTVTVDATVNDEIQASGMDELT